MAFGSKGGRDEDIAALVARKQYAKAIEIIRAQLQTRGADPRMRLQLGDILVLAGRPREAVSVLLPLADEYARDGFAAKAISVLKKIQKIDPGRREIDVRLAGLIEEKQRVATVPLPAPTRLFEIGIEEIDEGGGLEIGIGSSPISVSVPEPEPAPVFDHDLLPEEPAEPEARARPLEVEPRPVAVHVPPPEPEADAEIALEAEPIEIEADALELEAEPIEVEPEILETEPMSGDLFAQELLSALEEAFPPALGKAAAPATAARQGPSGGGTQIVVSPLFKDFTVDEMVAVIQGLQLLTFEAGDVILNEGEPGHSLYMLASGKVKIYRRNASGRSALVGELAEGAFFGEGSVLTGRPRNATVIAAGRCELLELGRATLDSITRTHPRVWDILREFAQKRQ
jgi:hypothetical protein